MPANRVVLAAIDEGGLRHDEPHVAGRGGTLKPLRSKPVVEVETDKPIVEPEVFGKPKYSNDVQDEQPVTVQEPSPVQSTTAEQPTESATEEAQSVKVHAEVTDAVTGVVESQVKKRKLRKNWEDL